MTSVWVFHRGALGDSVLLWPLLRALRAKAPAVTLVSDLSKAKLAERALGVRAVSGEQPRFSDLWVTDAHLEPGRILPVGGVSQVISLLPSQARERTWMDNARAMFPGAQVRLVDRRLDRVLALELAREHGHDGLPPARAFDAKAPVLLHVGAGSPTKRWPLRAWAQLHLLLSERPGTPSVRVVAGEAEAEQFGDEDRRAFDQLQGRFLSDLSELEAEVLASRLVVVADSGPAHLAAQLGVATVALFGPTVPQVWAPIGPRVRVVSPPAPMAMEWLTANQVANEVTRLLGA